MSKIKIGDKFEVMGNHSEQKELSKGVILTVTRLTDHISDNGLTFDKKWLGSFDDNGQVFVGGVREPLRQVKSKLTKNERIAHLEFQMKWMTNAVNDLLGIDNLEAEPKLKNLDQSVFDGLDEKWRFAAVDSNGKAHKFTHKVVPRIDEFSNVDDNVLMHYEFIGAGYDATNWRNSLIEREPKELTGSDYYYSNIAAKLLEEGQKLVTAYVSEESESDALIVKRVQVITSLDVEFNDTDGFGWEYVVPINNQGEPLTAADVGLGGSDG